MNNIKKYKLYRFLFLCSCLLLINCTTNTPEKYFDIAVLNINMFQGFANEGLSRELESPSVKMSEKNGEPEPMQRSEIINMKIQMIETNFEKVEKLKETKNTKDMINASLALYKYLLPVYKTEYVQLAELYDNNAPKDHIQSLTVSIHNQYYSRYTELYAKLIDAGKFYAEENSIKVNWGVY